MKDIYTNKNVIHYSVILCIIFFSFTLIAADDITNNNNLNEKKPVDTNFILEKNDQNPFDQHKELCFKLFKPGMVTLTIYNFENQEIRSLVSNYCEIGNHDCIWDGNDNSGNPVKSGVYKFSLKVQDTEQSHMIAYLR